MKKPAEMTAEERRNWEDFAEFQKGRLEKYPSLKIDKKRWQLENSEPCPVCRKNAELGEIPIPNDFPSGHSCPPAHDGCYCTIQPSREWLEKQKGDNLPDPEANEWTEDVFGGRDDLVGPR